MYAIRSYYEVGTRRRRVGGALGPDKEISAHAGGQVDDDIDPAGTDALDDLLIERHVARTLAGLGITDMAVHDGRTGLGCLV